ncbi:hypothetical protein LC724_05305 [Blautia sp. RD014234]|nr:hypothetical protein [Blautia parvula]
MFEAAEGVIIGAQSTSLSEDSLFCVVLVMILVLQILLTAGMVIIIMKHIDSSRDLRNILRKVDKMEEKLARNAGKRQKEKLLYHTVTRMILLPLQIYIIRNQQTT